MCLTYSETDTARLRKKCKGKTLRAWKLYCPNTDHLSSIYQRTRVEKAGNVVSDRRSIERTKYELRYSDVELGIHVFLNKSQAKQFANLRDSTWAIVPVTCRLRDLVAVGKFSIFYRSAVFMKVNISKTAFKQALR